MAKLTPKVFKIVDQMREAGRSWGNIAKQLNADGYLNEGKNWHYKTLCNSYHKTKRIEQARYKPQPGVYKKRQAPEKFTSNIVYYCFAYILGLLTGFCWAMILKVGCL